mgnify:CR=1 FL=1
MKEFRVAHTRNSPEIIMRPDGFIRISGRSIHPNVRDFLMPCEDWVDEYVKDPAELTCVDVSLEYFNSASAKALILIFEKIKQVTLRNKRFIFNWYYEEGDEDILERGEYFSTVLRVPFNFIMTL